MINSEHLSLDSARAYMIEEGLLRVVEDSGGVTLVANDKLVPRGPYPPLI